MALAAAGVTGAAMFILGLGNLHKSLSVCFGCPAFNNLLKGKQSVMQAVFGAWGDILMAFTARFVGIREGRISYDALVSSLPVGILRISLVTRLACDFPMLGQQE